MSKSIKCSVDGMTCTNCALTVEKSLEKQGASQVSADFISGEVMFEIPDDAEESTYFNAIQNAGYRIKDEHEEELEKGVPVSLWVITICTIPLFLTMFWPNEYLMNPYVQLLLSSIVLGIGIKEMGSKALASLRNRMPTMEVLVMIGSIAAYVYSIIGMIYYTDDMQNYMFFETSAMIIALVSWGHFLEEKTVSSTTKAIRDLMNLRPEYVFLVLRDSLGKETIQRIESQYVKMGDIVQLREGETIGADGDIISGEIWTDESMLTGESAALDKTVGDPVYEGTTMIKGNARIRVTKVGGESALSKIIDLVKSARATKPQMQTLADRISAVFVPLVIFIAIVTFFVNWQVVDLSVSESLMRSIAVLVISCPCAMGIATPAAVMVGLGRGSRMGILIRNGAVLEKFKDIKTFIFDKTGTLTDSNQGVKVHMLDSDYSDQEINDMLYTMESYSQHPIAQSILNNVETGTILDWDVQEIKGKGMQAEDKEGNVYRLGSPAWIKEYYPLHSADDAEVYLLVNDKLVAAISLEEEIVEDSLSTINELKNENYDVMLLSGDHLSRVQEVAQKLGIEEYYAEESPDSKLQKIKEAQGRGLTCMVGDGINDAPALSRSDISVSLAHASDIAQNTSDVILLGAQMSKIPHMLKLGKATFNTIKGNLFWAFFYNVVAIPIAATGLLDPSWAAGAMALSDVFLVLNSLRLRYKKL